MNRNTLTISKEEFFHTLSSLIKSGVTFEAKEDGSNIVIVFTGGY